MAATTGRTAMSPATATQTAEKQKGKKGKAKGMNLKGDHKISSDKDD